MLSNHFSLFITPLKLGSRWILETQSPFPRRKGEKGLVASKRYTSLWFSLFNSTSHSVAVWRGRVTSSPARNGPSLVLFYMCCWFWTGCLKCRPGNQPSLCVSERTQNRFRGRVHHLTTAMRKTCWSLAEQHQMGLDWCLHYNKIIHQRKYNSVIMYSYLYLYDLIFSVEKILWRTFKQFLLMLKGTVDFHCIDEKTKIMFNRRTSYSLCNKLCKCVCKWQSLKLYCLNKCNVLLYTIKY